MVECRMCGFTVATGGQVNVGAKRSGFVGQRVRWRTREIQRSRRVQWREGSKKGEVRERSRPLKHRWTCLDVGFLGGLEETLELLIATVAVVPIFKRLNLSPVLGFLVAGLALGPHGLRLVPNVEDISQIADIGVLFLLFEMGLELSIDRLKKLRVYAFGLGTLQMVATSIILAGGAKLMGAGISEALVIGSSLSLSSSAFVLQLLAERKEKSTRYATATFGVLLLQDVAVVPLLVLVPLLATTEWSGMQDITGLLFAVGATAIKAMAAVTGVVFGGGALLRPLFRFVNDSRSPEAFTSIVLATVLGAGWVTDQLGLSMTLGAFIAGVLLSESSFRAKIINDIEPFRGLLLGLFFITTGMSMDPELFLQAPLELIALIVSLITVKASTLGLLSLPFGLSASEAVKVGLILGQGGEFGFVIFALANKLGFLPDYVNQILVVVIVSTMALTPVLAELAARVAPAIDSSLAQKSTVGVQEDSRPREKSFNMKNAVVIIGYSEVGAVVSDMLSRKFLPFIAVDSNAEIVESAKRQGVPCIQAEANVENFLSKAGIQTPSAVVLTMRSSKSAIKTIKHVRSDFPDVPIYTRAHDLGRMRLLSNMGVIATFPESFETSLSLAEEVLRCYKVPEQDVTAIANTLRNERGLTAIQSKNDRDRLALLTTTFGEDDVADDCTDDDLEETSSEKSKKLEQSRVVESNGTHAAGHNGETVDTDTKRSTLSAKRGQGVSDDTR